MKYFTVWLGSVWYQHVAFSLMNVSIKRLLAAYFDKKKENKSIVSVFSSTYSLVTASWCLVGWARVTIFYCSYLYHFVELIHQDCLRLLRNSFFFYFQINEFLQEATQFQVEQSEALLWRNHALVHLSDSRVQAHLNSQVIFRYWRPHGRPHGICGSPLATFQLTSDIKISHILWVVRLSNTVSQKTVRRDSFPSGQPVLKKSLNSLRQPTCLHCINRFLSCQPGHFTIQSHYNFWKPLHPFRWSLSLFEVHLLTVLESEETFTQS